MKPVSDDTRLPGAATDGRSILSKLLSRKDLTVEEASELVRGMVDGRYDAPLSGALLAALAAKGESVGELCSFASVMRKMAVPFLTPASSSAMDMCGTGGAEVPTFNVSTVAAFVVSAAGLAVIKHGNSSFRGPCGSSDILEALLLPVKTSVDFSKESFRRERLAFLHAPLYHPAMKRVMPLRKALGIRTIFNQLGPLTNPACVSNQLVGSFSLEYGRKVVEVLARLGCVSALAVHSDDGTDEFSPRVPTNLVRQDDHGLSMERIDPSEILAEAERRGEWGPLPPEDAARAAVAILAGKEESARTGSVLLTAGAALWLAGRAADIGGGAGIARELIRSGAALSKFEALTAIAKEKEWG